MKLTKSCINYTGGKYKLLNQILPFFPKKINTFVDLFCGAGNVALNINAEKIYCYDINAHIIKLFKYIKSKNIDYLIKNIEDIITKYNLSNSEMYGYEYYNCDSSKGLSKFNKENYLKLREDFNSNNFEPNLECVYFYTLLLFSFNNQLRFNKQGNYNIPVGKRDFNSSIKNNLKNFHKTINEKNINFIEKDFRYVNINLNENDFLYADPPYLITTASYNEQKGWTKKEENDLLKLLDSLTENNIKFALSNVLENKGKKNKMLIDWASKYNINYLNYNYSNSNYQTKKGKSIEVLICNY